MWKMTTSSKRQNWAEHECATLLIEATTRAELHC